jgi:uncharacterized delta-60 repeat protein
MAISRNLLARFSCLLICSVSGIAAPGDVDESFDAGSFINGTVYALSPIQDGRTFIAGDFTSVRGGRRFHVARLLYDGSDDPTFNAGTITGGSFISGNLGQTGTVNCIQGFSDGRCLIGGDFDEVNGIPRKSLAWFSANGGLDQKRTPQLPSISAIYTMVEQSDGKILVGGVFMDSIFSKNTSRLIRLLPSGEIDAAFTQYPELGGSVRTVVVDTNEKILVGGEFSSFGGSPYSNFARLNSDGTVDTSFNPGSGVNGPVNKVALQTDGKIVIGGSFSRVAGKNASYIARLMPSGENDSTFNSTPSSTIFDIAIESTGDLVIAGDFTIVNGFKRGCIARLKTDGSLAPALFRRLDPSSVQAYADASGANHCIAIQENSILTGGSITWYKAATTQVLFRDSVLRWQTDGALETTFNARSGPDSGVFQIAPPVNGKTLIWGSFNNVTGVEQRSLALLNEDGSIDRSFKVPPAYSSSIRCQLPLRNGKFLIGGVMPTSSGIYHGGVVRLNANGSVDETFAIQTDDIGIGTVFSLYELPEGNILIGGNAIVKVRGDNGQIITGFVPSFSSVSGTFEGIGLQRDGRIIGSGHFTINSSQKTTLVLRLNSDGTLDPTFNSPKNETFEFATVKVLPNDKLLLGGRFPSFGTGRDSVVRLNANGQVDSSFLQGAAKYYGVTALDVQGNGKIVVSGRFEDQTGYLKLHIGRLTANGAVDTGFSEAIISDINESVGNLVVQPDGSILAAGNFRSINGRGINFVTRLLGDPVPAIRARFGGSQAILEWQPPEAILLTAPTLDSGYVLVSGATTPWTNVVNGQQFFKLRLP